MAELKIKSQHASKIVAFGGGGKTPVGQRSQADLRKLAILGHQSGDKSILDLFDGQLPSLTDLQKEQTTSDIAKGPK